MTQDMQHLPPKHSSSSPMPQLWRLGLLALLLTVTLGVLGRAIATSKGSSMSATSPSATFPPSVPLQIGPFSKTMDVRSESGEVVGQKYQYQQEGQTITAEVREEWGDGNVSRFLFVHTPIRTANATMQIRFQPGIGYYGVLTHAGQAYLSACVNSRGNSTVTEPQFTQNQYQQDLDVGRLLPWLLGQTSLVDGRCLWTLMSIPLDQTASPEAAYETLATVWNPWTQWWKSNFLAVR
jgi:cyanosortase A-associated protein